MMVYSSVIASDGTVPDTSVVRDVMDAFVGIGCDTVGRSHIDAIVDTVKYKLSVVEFAVVEHYRPVECVVVNMLLVCCDVPVISQKWAGWVIADELTSMSG